MVLRFGPKISVWERKKTGKDFRINTFISWVTLASDPVLASNSVLGLFCVFLVPENALVASTRETTDAL